MSYFQISDAPRIHIHPLPVGTLLARLQGTPPEDPRQWLEISTWLGEDWADGTTEARSSDADREEAFKEEHCDSCSFYFDVDDIPVRDLRIDVSYQDEEVDIRQSTLRVASPCPCYRDGIDDVDWPCASGEDYRDYDPSDLPTAEGEPITYSYTRFTTRLNPSSLQLGPSTRGYGCFYGVALQRIECVNGTWLQSGALRSLNAFDEAGGEICWGYGTATPVNLADAAATYVRTPSNDDLLRLDGYDHNIENLDRTQFTEPTQGVQSISGALFEPTAGEHALLIASTATPQTFLLLGTAPGAQIINGVAAVLATWHPAVPLPNGDTLGCWLSPALPDGTRWLAAMDPETNQPLNGLLIGQLKLPADLCASTPPTSSAPAALAAT